VTRRALANVAGVALTLAALAFVAVRLAWQADRLPPVVWSSSALAAVVAALAAGVLTAWLGAGAAAVLLHGGVPVSWRESFTLLGKSQIGKYLPGNVFQYLGRVALAARRGLPVEPVVLALGVETVLAVATAMGVAAAGWLLDSGGDDRLPSWLAERLTLVGLAALAAVGATAAAAGLAPAVRTWLRARRGYLAPGRVAAAAALYVVNFALLGLSVELLLRGVWGLEPAWGWPQFAWRFALIWAVGLLVPGAPAGLGVREALLLAWFSPELGEPATLGLAVLLRVVTTMADVLTFLLASVSDRSPRR
jgi:hypothetical protein